MTSQATPTEVTCSVKLGVHTSGAEGAAVTTKIREHRKYECTIPFLQVPAGSPSHGGVVIVYIKVISQLSLPTPF